MEESEEPREFREPAAAVLLSVDARESQPGVEQSKEPHISKRSKRKLREFGYIIFFLLGAQFFNTASYLMLFNELEKQWKMDMKDQRGLVQSVWYTLSAFGAVGGWLSQGHLREKTNMGIMSILFILGSLAQLIAVHLNDGQGQVANRLFIAGYWITGYTVEHCFQVIAPATVDAVESQAMSAKERVTWKTKLNKDRIATTEGTLAFGLLVTAFGIPAYTIGQSVFNLGFVIAAARYILSDLHKTPLVEKIRCANLSYRERFITDVKDIRNHIRPLVYQTLFVTIGAPFVTAAFDSLNRLLVGIIYEQAGIQPTQVNQLFASIPGLVVFLFTLVTFIVPEKYIIHMEDHSRGLSIIAPLLLLALTSSWLKLGMTSESISMSLFAGVLVASGIAFGIQTCANGRNCAEFVGNHHLLKNLVPLIQTFMIYISAAIAVTIIQHRSLQVIILTFLIMYAIDALIGIGSEIASLITTPSNAQALWVLIKRPYLFRDLHHHHLYLQYFLYSNTK